MIIYRVENDAGQGPYRLGHGVMWNKLFNPEQRPFPSMDPGLEHILASKKDLIKDFFFGFNSLEQLRDWFEDEELISLDNIGFKIKTFDVPDALIIEGSAQLLFKKTI
jgi:hypothetical protein